MQRATPALRATIEGPKTEGNGYDFFEMIAHKTEVVCRRANKNNAVDFDGSRIDSENDKIEHYGWKGRII